ncbi:unnamed protein product [Rotaria magnacalcarata]|uniref:Uncharacterized protein n=1 Tax=Rotaria magnacalcarata TaxID=392030 RepID=A0A8S3CIJ5_9BILA|nr:unnamed protein product [Rotaria magnacalcarata]
MEKSPTQDDTLCRQLFKTHEASLSLLYLVFADFSYCSCKPSHMKILEPSIRKSLSSTESSKINILLIDETDVDKLTLINALINYLAFRSLYDVRNDQPIVLIHVSFMVKIGDRFEESLINFGRFNSNENHHSLGHSVTQYIVNQEENLYSANPLSTFNVKLCKSLHELKKKYVVVLNEVQQDDPEQINIDYIYNYIGEILAYPVISQQMEVIKRS